MALIPVTIKALVLRQSQTSQKALYHEVVLEERPLIFPQAGEVIVKMHAVAFNHREVLGFQLTSNSTFLNCAFLP